MDLHLVLPGRNGNEVKGMGMWSEVVQNQTDHAEWVESWLP